MAEGSGSLTAPHSAGPIPRRRRTRKGRPEGRPFENSSRARAYLPAALALAGAVAEASLEAVFEVAAMAFEEEALVAAAAVLSGAAAAAVLAPLSAGAAGLQAVTEAAAATAAPTIISLRSVSEVISWSPRVRLQRRTRRWPAICRVCGRAQE